MVALVLLSVIMMALAPVLFRSVAQQKTAALRLERTGALLGETNRLLALPFDDLDGQDGRCANFPGPQPFAHSRCIDVWGGGGERSIVIRVTPGDPAVGADSMVFTRTRGGAPNPFNTAP